MRAVLLAVVEAAAVAIDRQRRRREDASGPDDSSFIPAHCTETRWTWWRRSTRSHPPPFLLGAVERGRHEVEAGERADALLGGVRVRHVEDVVVRLRQRAQRHARAAREAALRRREVHPVVAELAAAVGDADARRAARVGAELDGERRREAVAELDPTSRSRCAASSSCNTKAKPSEPGGGSFRLFPSFRLRFSPPASAAARSGT